MKKITLIIMILLIIFSITLTGCDIPPLETRPIKSCFLYGERESNSGGEFILGFATYESSNKMTTKYYLYVKGVEGYRLQEIDSSYVELVETNDNEPSIKGVFTENGEVCTYTYYTIYVPVGTITEEYSAELMMKEK